MTAVSDSNSIVELFGDIHKLWLQDVTCLEDLEKTCDVPFFFNNRRFEKNGNGNKKIWLK